MLIQELRLYESPVLRIGTPEETVELSLEKLDTAEGMRRDAVHLRAVLEKAAALETGGEPGAVVEAVRLWFFHAFGEESYERIFTTPARRCSYAWHEKVFMAAREALARARTEFLAEAAEQPVLEALRREWRERLAENLAAAALSRGDGHVDDAGQH